MLRHLFVFSALLLIAGTTAMGQRADILRRAQQAAQAGKWDQVRTITKGTHGTGPEAAAIYLLSSYGHLQTSDADAAAERARLAIEADSTLLQAWLLRGEALMMGGKPQDGLEVYAELVRRYPDSARATYAFGVALARNGLCEQAITPLEETMFKRPENLGVVAQLAECYLLTERFQEAADLYGRLYDLEPSDARFRVSFVESLMRLEKYDSVISILRPRTTITPPDTTSLTAIGYAYQQTQQYDEALAALSAVTTATPDNANAWYNLGSAEYNSGDLQGAIRSFKRAISLQPNLGPAWFNMALAYTDEGFVEEAIRAFKRAAVLLPEKASKCYSSIGVINRGLGHIDEAIKAHDRSISLDPDNPEVYASKGHTLVVSDRWEEGRIFLEGALERFPGNAEILYPLAKCYLRVGKVEAAKKIAADLEEHYPIYSSELRMMMRN